MRLLHSLQCVIRQPLRDTAVVAIRSIVNQVSEQQSFLCCRISSRRVPSGLALARVGSNNLLKRHALEPSQAEVSALARSLHRD